MSGEGAIGLAPSASWTRSLAFLDPPLPSSSCPITPCSTRVPASGDERFRTLSSDGSKLRSSPRIARDFVAIRHPQHLDGDMSWAYDATRFIPVAGFRPAYCP